MEENKVVSLDVFLKEYGFEEYLTDKEKFYILGKIIERHDVDKDCEDFRYSKILEEAKTEEIRNEHANTIRNLDIKIMNATGYYYMLDTKFKKERKLKRKETFQKMISIFKRNK